MQVTKTMLIALVTPVIAVVIGLVVLDEKLNWRLLAGAACIISGIGLIVVRTRMKRGSMRDAGVLPLKVR
jgi:drug/metabolite transporter (DMT)-like permease